MEPLLQLCDSISIFNSGTFNWSGNTEHFDEISHLLRTESLS